MHCPKCGLAYDDFRTGHTYQDIYDILWPRKWKRRNTVLGKWHEIKLGLWAHHLETCIGLASSKEALPQSRVAEY